GSTSPWLRLPPLRVCCLRAAESTQLPPSQQRLAPAPHSDRHSSPQLLSTRLRGTTTHSTTTHTDRPGGIWEPNRGRRTRLSGPGKRVMPTTLKQTYGVWFRPRLTSTRSPWM